MTEISFTLLAKPWPQASRGRIVVLLFGHGGVSDGKCLKDEWTEHKYFVDILYMDLDPTLRLWTIL